MKHLLVLDWDDTLLPSSWIASILGDAKLRASGDIHSLLPHDQLRLIAYDQKVAQFLKSRYAEFDVFIVTNAECGWVESSAARFMSRVRQVILRLCIPVISARTLHESKFPHDMYAWKRIAFQDLVSEWVQSQRPMRFNFHFISIGDGDTERAATLFTSNIWRECIMKFIRLDESPSIDTLLKQVHVLHDVFPMLVRDPSRMDMSIRPEFVQKYFERS